MNQRVRGRHLLACFLLTAATLTGHVRADSGEALLDFKKGIAYARQNDWHNALREFERAREQGLDHPKLEYNLGVANYQLGNYKTAAGHFRTLLRQADYAAVANYNLGLIADKLKEQERALQHFRLAADGDNAAVRTLARDASHSLTADGSPASRAAKHTMALHRNLRWQPDSDQNRLRLLTATGYNDNVFRRHHLHRAGRSGDGYVSYTMAGSHRLRSGLQLAMNFNLTDYARLDAYDLQQLQITGSYEKHTRHWQLHLVADNEQLSLAGLPYQQNRALGGRLGWRWQRLHQFYTDMLLRQSEALDSQYEHLQGEQRQLQLGWLLTRPSHRLELALRLNREHRVGDTYGVNHFDSYSPLTRSLWMALDYHFSRRWQLFNQFELAYSRYLENDLINGHPVRGEVVALDWVSQLQFRLSRRFRLLMEYAWHDNLSPQLRRRYQNRVSLLGLQWQY